MPLKLKLRAGESLYLSGALVRNGASNTEIEILNKVPILREKDIMLESEANTPCRQIYFALQTLYLQPESQKLVFADLSKLSAEILKAAPSMTLILERIHNKITEQSYFEALKLGKELIGYEAELVGHVQSNQ